MNKNLILYKYPKRIAYLSSLPTGTNETDTEIVFTEIIGEDKEMYLTEKVNTIEYDSWSPDYKKEISYYTGIHKSRLRSCQLQLEF
tara:strand:- start:44 stop:301 length:258 start_codon:yes stop_codon:yes gene_type:complete